MAGRWLTAGALAMLAAGCGSRPDGVGERRQAAVAPVATPAPAASVAAASPPRLASQAERGEKGARNLLLEFVRALEQRRVAAAWRLLGPVSGNGGQPWSEAGFTTAFGGLGRAMVAVGDGAMEGAAGSSYYTAPIVVTGSDREGRPVRLSGEAVVRRVNDVPGASAAQLRWHFAALRVDWVH